MTTNLGKGSTKTKEREHEIPIKGTPDPKKESTKLNEKD